MKSKRLVYRIWLKPVKKCQAEIKKVYGEPKSRNVTSHIWRQVELLIKIPIQEDVSHYVHSELSSM